MPTTSNLYADYILGQHPISCWTLDEDLSTGVSVNLGSSGLSFYSSSTVNAIEANSYNYTGQNGYYISSKTSNASIPMIYGSYNSTLAGNQGAIILPAYGFLNSLGKYNSYTFETWLKINNPYTSDIKKLISCFIDYTGGGLDDNNGLYFNDTSFILKMGNKYDTHYIKDFNKPMLIQLIYSTNNFSLFVNGELLIQLNLDSTDINKLTTSSQNYIMLSNAYYDTAAIYNYVISKNQIKLNYSKALNVQYPDYLISLYNGRGFKIDYKTAKYSNSIKIPNNMSGNNWQKAMKNNLDTKDLSISNNQYSLPIFNFSNSTGSQSILESAGIFKFKTSTWSTAEANIKFDKLDMLSNDKIKGFYLDGTFATLPTAKQTIFKIINKTSKNYFKISIDSSYIYYYFKWGTNAEKEITKVASSLNFFAGIDIDLFIKKFPEVQQFFVQSSDLVVYVAGEETLSSNTTLSANINSVKFLNLINLKQKTSLVDTNGIIFYDASKTSQPIENAILGSYDLNLFYNSTLNKYYFSVGTSGYWKNHIPLQNLATYTTNVSGTKTYSLDFIQFNIDHSAPLTKTQVSGNWIFDTVVSSPYLKTYITFEQSNSAYASDSTFTTKVQPNINRTIIPGSGTNWQTTRYEIVDDFIIYMPDTIDISSYSIVMSVEISIPDTLYNNIEIKKIELISKTLNNDSSKSNPIFLPNSITPLEPYTYTINSGNFVYNYKTKNPYIINKETQQYLQLSRQSGLRLVGDYVAGQYRGIKYNINNSQLSSYNISSFQTFIYYEGLATRTNSTITTNYFSSTPVEIFQIQTKTKNIKFYIKSTTPGVDTQTGQIYSVTDSGVTDDNLKYYINGKLQTNPIINANEWTALGIEFIDKLIFDSYTGYLSFTGPISFDNMSFYQLKRQKNLQSLKNKTWGDVQTSLSGSTYIWSSWSSLTWADLLKMGNVSAITGDNMYNMFVGTNRFVSDSSPNRDIVVMDESYWYYDATVNQTKIYSAL